MQLFADYIKPMTHWLHYNPEWAFLITFLISLTESLAIIGSIIPGSVTMTGIGILAGSGVIPIDMTFIAATLGAVTGDGASYLLGYFFSDRLIDIWPFKRYPKWLAYGKAYFADHGGKSVLIGRFIGPLRSIIPVIAGMMHMSHWRFYTANFISAIFWSILYILPGVIIGAASNELPPEMATKLFAFILGVLAGIWILGFLIKYLLIQFNHYMNASLNHLWQRALTNPYIQRFAKAITPRNEQNHYHTAVIVVLWFVLAMLLIVLSMMVIKQGGIPQINNPLFYATQSLRDESIDCLFIYITQIASLISLATVVTFSIILMFGSKQFRLMLYFSALIITTQCLLFIFHQFLFSHHPTGILEVQQNSSFPSPNLTYATVIFSSFLLYFNNNNQLKFKPSLNLFFIVLLILIGFGKMLLGDHWFSDIIASYSLGIISTLTFWIFYRRTSPTNTSNPLIVLPYIGLLLLGSIVASRLNFETQFRDHQPYVKQYILTNKVWWEQKKPILPIYQKNRFGRAISLFNIQYAGSLEELNRSLLKAGWTKPKDSFYKTLLKYPVYHEAPIVPQLFLNRKPSLIMRYPLHEKGPTLILRLWRSNYYLQDYQQHLWIGTVHTRLPLKKYKPNKPNATTPLFYIEHALPNQFTQRKVRLWMITTAHKLAFRVEPVLLLIREKSGDEIVSREKSDNQ